MSKQCSSCGTHAPDDASVFCNRCGARLPVAGPAPIPACRQCGAPVTDRLSRFCSRCGSPLVAEVLAAAPPARHAQGKVCPGCGFENFGENLFYCKKCGAIFPKNEPVRPGGVAETTPALGSQKGPIRIVPDGMDELRQKPGNAAEAARRIIPVETPVMRRRPPPAAAAAGKPRKPLPWAPSGWWKTGSNRKTVIAVAVLVLIIIAVILASAPGILNTGPADATTPDVPDSAAPDIPVPTLWVNLPAQTPAINQAVPVVTDTISEDELDVTDTISEDEPDITDTISEDEPDVTDTISEDELD